MYKKPVFLVDGLSRTRLVSVMLKLSSWGMWGYSGGGSLAKMAAFPSGVQLAKLSSRLLFIPSLISDCIAGIDSAF